MKKYFTFISLVLVLTFISSLFITPVYATPAMDLFGIYDNPGEEEKQEEKNKETQPVTPPPTPSEILTPKEQPTTQNKEAVKSIYVDTTNLQNSTINLIINGEKIIFPDQQPIVLNDRTYVPVRFLAEALGATVEWDNDNQVVIITNNGLQKTEDNTYYSRYYLKLGEPQIISVVYSKHVEGFAEEIMIFDIPEYPFISSENRTMLPFRFIAEILGAFIYYDDSTHSAIAVYDPNNKSQDISPSPVLSTLTQDYFKSEIMKVRIANKPQLNERILNLNSDNELMAAATWKALDLFKHYAVDHSNSDGTYKGTRFFELYMSNKYGGKVPYQTLECIKRTNFLPFTGLDFITKEYNMPSYYSEIDVMSVLKDAEYWYQHLVDAWGLNLNPLTTSINLATPNGKEFPGFLANPSFRIDGYPYYAFSSIIHWNEDMYRAYARNDINGWMNSSKHKEAVLSGAKIFGYGTKITHSGGYSAFLPGAKVN